MNGIDKITETISSKALERAGEITLAAKKQGEEIIAAAKENAKKKANEISLDAKKQAEVIVAAASSSCEQAERQVLLKAKGEILGEMLTKIKERLINLPAEEYFALLLSLAKENAISGPCTVYMNKRDLARAGDSFKNDLAAFLKEKGSDCAFSQECKEIDGGLILDYGKIAINLSFSEIIDEKADIIKEKLNELLF